jgi:hypothetical protein
VNLLALVLSVKVLFTLILWALPLLTFPTSWLVRMGMPEPKPMLFLRLLGAAYLALVVGYISGLRRLGRGDEVQDVVWVGITSNGSAFLILLLFGIAGAWKEWRILARIYMWVSVVATGSITLGLVVAGIFLGDR